MPEIGSEVTFRDWGGSTYRGVVTAIRSGVYYVAVLGYYAIFFVYDHGEPKYPQVYRLVRGGQEGDTHA
jgi:hypothetical protein